MILWVLEYELFGLCDCVGWVVCVCLKIDEFLGFRRMMLISFMMLGFFVLGGFSILFANSSLISFPGLIVWALTKLGRGDE